MHEAPQRREIQAKIKRQQVPTEQDWGNYQSDLDQNDAYKAFHNKTNQEMQSYFRKTTLGATGDLRWMPKIPFQYYMIGFRDFITAEIFEPGYASDATSCFLNLIIDKLENHPDFIVAIMPDLMPTIEFVASHQARFKANIDIYGNFHKKLKQIQKPYSQYSR
jgi:hypothetical protein